MLPNPAAPLDAQPGELVELWAELEGFVRSPTRSSRMAMLLTADLRRKARDQSRRACGPMSDESPLGDSGPTLRRVAYRGIEEWIFFAAPRAGRPTVILVHGLFDSKHTRYLHVVARLLIEHGFGAVIPDMRGHGCRFFESKPSLGPDEAAELATLSRWIAARHPDSPVGLFGFSLGALSTIHALSSPDAERLFPAGAIALSPPGDLSYAMSWLDRRPTDLFGLAFRAWLGERLRSWDAPRSHAAPFRSALEWLAGDASIDGILDSADPSPALRKVKRPLLVVASLDDPFFTAAAVRYLELAAAGRPCIKVLSTEAGGHLGHLSMYPEWSARTIVRFFSQAYRLQCSAEPTPTEPA